MCAVVKSSRVNSDSVETRVDFMVRAQGVGTSVKKYVAQK